MYSHIEEGVTNICDTLQLVLHPPPPPPIFKLNFQTVLSCDGVTTYGVFGLVIRFIELFNTQLVTTLYKSLSHSD
jgi:hypothetical protein